MTSLTESDYTYVRFKGVDYGIIPLDADPLFCIVFPLDSDGTKSVRVLKVIDASGDVAWSVIAPEGIKEEDASMWFGAAVAGLTFARESYELQQT